MVRQEDAKVKAGPTEKVGFCAFGAGCGDEGGKRSPACGAGAASLKNAGGSQEHSLQKAGANANREILRAGAACLPLVDGGACDDDDDICGRAWAAAGMVGLLVLVMAVGGVWNFFGSSAKASAQSEQSVAVVDGEVRR